MFLYTDYKDTVERGVINLSSAQLNYEYEDGVLGRNFSLLGKSGGEIHFKSPSEKEVHDWLYAIDPLAAGQLRSKSARLGEMKVEVDNHESKLDPNQQCSI